MIFDTIVHFALGCHVVMLLIAMWRILTGENIIDKIIAFDLMGILSIAILILMSLATGSRLFIYVAAGLAFLGFVITIVLSQWVMRQKGEQHDTVS